MPPQLSDVINRTMAGQPFKVGRFAHSLRMRLMREHVGVDVDAMSDPDYMPREEMKPGHEQVWDPDSEQEQGDCDVTRANHETPLRNMLSDANEGIKQGSLKRCYFGGWID